MSISAAQCRAARALLGISQDGLAKAAKVAKATIANFEASRRQPYNRTLDDLRAALESAGVIFIETHGEGPGVRLKKPFKHDASHLTALWKRSAGLMRVRDGIVVDETPDGLVCRRGRLELGRIVVVDGEVIISPPIGPEPLFVGRLTPTELQTWLDVAASTR